MSDFRQVTVVPLHTHRVDMVGDIPTHVLRQLIWLLAAYSTDDQYAFLLMEATRLEYAALLTSGIDGYLPPQLRDWYSSVFERLTLALGLIAGQKMVQIGEHLCFESKNP